MSEAHSKESEARFYESEARSKESEARFKESEARFYESEARSEAGRAWKCYKVGFGGVLRDCEEGVADLEVSTKSLPLIKSPLVFCKRTFCMF